jgi:hypothetical protein
MKECIKGLLRRGQIKLNVLGHGDTHETLELPAAHGNIIFRMYRIVPSFHTTHAIKNLPSKPKAFIPSRRPFKTHESGLLPCFSVCR